MAFLNTKSNRQPSATAASFLPTGKTANISPTALGFSVPHIPWVPSIYPGQSKKGPHMSLATQGSPCKFRAPCVRSSKTFDPLSLFPDISVPERVSSISWLLCQWLGCTTQVCKACPASRWKKVLAQNQLQKHQLFNG